MKTINDIKAALSYDTMVDLVSKGQKERAAARMKRERAAWAEREYLTRTGKVLRVAK